MSDSCLRIDPVFDGVSFGPLLEAFAKANAGRSVHGCEPRDWGNLLPVDDLMVMPLGGFLVRGMGRTMLIDLGLGHRPAAPSIFTFRGGAFLDSLTALGVEADEVSDVILTHLHYDHVGWATVGGAVTFPRATYWCDVLDWERFADDESPDEWTRDVLRPIKPVLKVWSEEGPLFDGVSVIRVPGHTPGSSVISVDLPDGSVMFLGDLVHHPIQLEQDRWGALGDLDYELAQTGRERIIAMLTRGNVVAFPAHFHAMKPGRLRNDGAGRRWVDDGLEMEGLLLGDFDAIAERSRALVMPPDADRSQA